MCAADKRKEDAHLFVWGRPVAAEGSPGKDYVSSGWLDVDGRTDGDAGGHVAAARRRRGNDEKCGGESRQRRSGNMIEEWRRRLDRLVVDVLERIFYRWGKA